MFVLSWFAPQFADEMVRGSVCGDIDSLFCVYFSMQREASRRSEMIRFTLYHHNSPAIADWFKPDNEDSDTMTCDFTHEPIG